MKKTTLLIIIALIVPTFLSAQEQAPTRKHEVGITFSSLNSFGLTYKTGRKSTMFRLGLLSLNLQNNNLKNDNDSINHKYSGYGVGFRLGFEKRIQLVQNFNFLIGLDAGCSYEYRREKDKDYNVTQPIATYWTVTPSLSCVIGASYIFKDALVISAEVYPSIWYSFGKNTYENGDAKHEVKTTQLGFGFNNTTASLTFAYRFGK
ncbi:MAG: hypothetical protein M0P58_08750 [Bacteroidales bacterium]|jgi:hypothetical protein|nr:hypothetical protein [Bacteroidales bacterium]